MATGNPTLNQTFNISTGVSQLQELGLFNYILPFGIFFVLMFGILDKYHVVSKDRKINALISFLTSAFVLLYAYINEIEWFFALFYTKMAIALVIMLFAITLAVFVFRGLKENGVIPAGKENVWSAATIMIATMVVNAAFVAAPEPLGTWALDVSSIVIGLAFLGAVASFFTTGKGGKEESG